MPGTINDAQVTLNSLYAIRTAALLALNTPQADIVSYELGDRRVAVRSYEDLKPLENLIRQYESIVTSDIVVLPNMSGNLNTQGPILPCAGNGFGWGY